MRLAIVHWTSGGFSGGYRKYIQELTPRLRAQPGIGEVCEFYPAVSERPPEAKGFAGTKELQEAAAAWRPDVVFVPTARVLRIRGARSVTMVRNMEPLLCPQAGARWSERLRNYARWWAARRACSAADRVLAVSEAVRDYLRLHWRVESSRIGVVPHGVEERQTGESSPPPGAAAADAGRFFFTAGSLRPARGLEDLMEAYLMSPGLPPLWIAGSATAESQSYAGVLRRESARWGLPFRWLGELTPGEMAWCYRNARAFVMTSRAEACPNVVLEAMAHGAASLSVDLAPMPEFFGASARYYPAGDAPALGRLLAEWARPESDLAGWRASGRARAAEFTWERTARRTYEELELAWRG